MDDTFAEKKMSVKQKQNVLQNIDIGKSDISTLQNMCTKLCILNDKFCYSIIKQRQIVNEIQKNIVSTDRLRQME